MWRNAVNAIVEFRNLEESGWYLNGHIQWVDDVFPPTIEQLLIDEIGDKENANDAQEIENIEDEGIYGSDIDYDYKTFDQNCYIHIHCLCLFSYKNLNQILKKIFNYLVMIKH